MNLPHVDNWTIETFVRTNLLWMDVPTDYVNMFIDGELIQLVMNQVIPSDVGVSHIIFGDSFTYRFEFSSPTTIENEHLTVLEETVTSMQGPARTALGNPEPVTATLGLMGLGVLGMTTRRRVT